MAISTIDSIPRDKLLATVQEVAKLLKISDYLVRQGVKKGQFEGVMIGGVQFVKLPPLLRKVCEAA